MHKKFAKGKMFNVNLQRHFAKDKSPIPKVYQGYTIASVSRAQRPMPCIVRRLLPPLYPRSHELRERVGRAEALGASTMTWSSVSAPQLPNAKDAANLR